jgi:aminoglycoside 3-N-acetyltransferase I
MIPSPGDENETETRGSFRVVRLGSSDLRQAQELFATMAAVFDEGHDELSDRYVETLLARDEMWIVAACSGDVIVGGLTAHVLPLTRSETRELFIYDLAVRVDHQRQGVGRLLIRELLRLAAAAGIGVIFVPADNEDLHALEFYRAVGGIPSPVTIFTFNVSTRG